jgi:hypothetical protein
LPAWTVIAWVLVLISIFLMPPPRLDPSLTPVNIDYVWGFSDTEAQHWMPPGIWVAALMILLPVLLYASIEPALAGLKTQVPAPLIGAGLPAMAVLAGGYWLVRKLRGPR